MDRIDIYVNEVLGYIIADRKMKLRIKSDLTLQINEASRSESVEDVIRMMGDPKDVAKEFMDSIYEDKEELIGEMMNNRSNGMFFLNRVYEYKSKSTLFGIPLVHIKLSRYGMPCVAKGIIAIGTVSIGVISIGAIPFGLISFGGAAFGLVAFGGLSVGLLLALGGLAIGALAIGGLAVGLGAIGGLAVGEIALGDSARGTVAIGANTVGKYTLVIRQIGPETSEKVAELIKTAFPNLPDWIAGIFTSIGAYNIKN